MTMGDVKCDGNVKCDGDDGDGNGFFLTKLQYNENENESPVITAVYSLLIL